MAENKFRKTDGSVEEFLNGIENERKRKDSIAIVELMRQVTGEEPELWGSIIGFGNYHYRYESGREGDSPVAGFSPRKQNLTIYVFEDVDRYEPLLSRLGKFKTGKVCIYINKLDDIDLPTLREIVRRSTEDVVKKYPN
ncbi:MAG TPA: DUF1801 domain-containing protein [Anaerolineales bacterium]|nr:DUF1801 domain-containing protein [Anaerolineales bacterium]